MSLACNSQSISYLIRSSLSEQILKNPSLITLVLISAANQKETTIIQEIIKNPDLGYSVTKDVVLGFVEADLGHLLK